jgi:hypothetical protein
MLQKKCSFSVKSDKNNGHFTGELCKFMIISHWILLRMRNILGKSCTENQNTHFIFNKFFKENCALVRYSGKTCYSQTGHKWQYNTVQNRCQITDTHSGRVKVKVKESRNRLGVAQRVPGGLGSQISMTFGKWRWWCRQPHAPAAFTPRKCSW